MILVWIFGIGAGIGAGILFDSVIAGIIGGLIVLGSCAAAWNEAGATVAQATQPRRDKQIIEELKKMNGE